MISFGISNYIVRKPATGSIGARNLTETPNNVESSSCIRDFKPSSEISSKFFRSNYDPLSFKGISKNKCTKASSNISFQANPIYNINLRKLVSKNTKDYKLIPARFSELLVGSESDKNALVRLNGIWKNIGETEYTCLFVRDYMGANNKKVAYYAVEIANPGKKLHENIICLMETTNPKTFQGSSTFNVNLLQASPTVAGKKDNSEIKGSGELALYCAVKLAKEHKYKKVHIVSTNDKFYEKMKFERKGTDKNKRTIFELASNQFDKFLKRVEDKYDLPALSKSA